MSEQEPDHELDYSNARIEHAMLSSDVRDALNNNRTKITNDPKIQSLRGALVRDEGMYNIVIITFTVAPTEHVVIVQLPDEETHMPGKDNINISIDKDRASYFGFPDYPVDDETMSFCRMMVNEAEWLNPI